MDAQRTTNGLVRAEATTDLLLAVAEQLKTPLSVIARQAELEQLTGTAADMATIRTQTNAALTLVDSYLLGLELLRTQTNLDLEPVSVSSLLTDTAHDLYGYARQYGVDLELHIAGRYEPVMANARGLRAALISLGYVMIETQASQAPDKKRWLTLATYRSAQGIVAGVYGTYEDNPSAAEWRRAIELCGRAGQPFAGLVAGSSAGLFVADTILQAMSTRLRVGKHQKQGGLATTLRPSQQLVLV